ncbi:cytochrome P450 2U1-like isoform X2 [Ptychodera flava]|uniref:cytochrome P450 2U1-like isoform X2 n=1 Tax=Ptychodera flava TaxID=63121 RepID=UPI00396A4329
MIGVTIAQSNPITYILVTTALILSAFLVFLYKAKQKSLPPGPWGLPVIGCLPLLDKSAPFKSMVKLTEKFGNVYSLQMGSTMVVVLNGYQAIKEAFVNKGDTFKGRPSMVLSDLIGAGRGIVFATYDDDYKEQRNFAVSALKGFGWGSSAFADRVMNEVDGLIEDFESIGAKPFAPFHYVRNSVCNIIFSIVFGRRYRHDDAEFRNLLTTHHQNMLLCGSATAVNFIPLLQYLPFGNYQKVLTNHVYFRTCLMDMIEKHKRTYNPDDIRDFIDLYLREIEIRQQRNEKSSFDYDNIRRVANDLFTVGTETTATTILWLILYMVAFPEVQQRVYDELKRVVGTDRRPNLEDKPKLPYIEATIMEVQRIASVLPLSVPHSSMVDTEINGHKIPKDTVVIANLWSVLHESDGWEEPEKFNPERFLNKDGSVHRPDNFIPFSVPVCA